MVISSARKQQHRKDLIGEPRKYNPSAVDYTKISNPKKKVDKQQKRLV